MCVFLVSPILLKGQDCYIIMKIKGTIVLESTGQVLQKDDQICGNDNVIFKTADAVAIVHSTLKGKYTLRANKNRTSEIEEVIISTVSTVLSKNTANLSTLDTRGSDNLLIDDFGTSFCVIDNYELYLDEDEYPPGKDYYFMIRFIYKDSLIETKLENNNNVVYLKKEIIFKPLSKDAELTKLENVSLYYCSNKNPDKPQLINAFDLSFPDERKLKDELSNYIMLLRTSGKTEEDIQEELIEYMFDAYGNVDNENFLKWVNENVK